MGRKILERQGLPKHALVCERHVGSGITKEEIIRKKLPLPKRNMLPISIEEQIICYADKFFSKSKGNVISPIDMSDKFGTDALRMALIIGNPPRGSVSLSENKIKGYKHFSNKIWNASRFVLLQINGSTKFQIIHPPKFCQRQNLRRADKL